MKQPAATIESNLKAIRSIVDVDLADVHIDDVVEHGKRLIAMMGLSSECMAAAQRRLQEARLIAIKKYQEEGYPPSVLLKLADGECAIEHAMYDYADRLNAAITHQVEFIRTVVSKYKEELKTATL